MTETDATLPDLDREGLLRRTFGDNELARELLDLFEVQCLRLRSRLVDPDPGSRTAALHSLRGAALAVGAERVARLACGKDVLEGDWEELASDELLRALDDVVNVIRSEHSSRQAMTVSSPAARGPGSHVER